MASKVDSVYYGKHGGCTRNGNDGEKLSTKK